mmetsp:Transcript_13803/g.50267  ORF Transcript_13803/g.50267 Transcript_13803/m.50267 type:complete len:537 (+) Transcript_13803:188-1798(+)
MSSACSASASRWPTGVRGLRSRPLHSSPLLSSTHSWRCKRLARLNENVVGVPRIQRDCRVSCSSSSSGSNRDGSSIGSEPQDDSPQEAEEVPRAPKKSRGRKKKATEPLESAAPTSTDIQSGNKKGELIFTLERFGYGWGEEILPRLDVTYASVREGKATLPASNLEELLEQCGVHEGEVERVLNAASTWRVTKGGRHLIDKRRRLRIKESLPDLFRLCSSLGVSTGGFGTLVMAVPEVLVPGVAKQWDRMFVIWACHQLQLCQLEEEMMAEVDYWCERQVEEERRNRLTADKRQRLEHLNFEWGFIDGAWERNFDELVEYYLENGDCLVDPGTSLGEWCKMQRMYYKDSKLPEWIVSRLKVIDFVWTVEEEPQPVADTVEYGGFTDTYASKLDMGIESEREQTYQRELAWHQNVRDLERFINRHGHSDVPKAWGLNTSLGAWVSWLRQRKQEDRLSGAQIRSVESVGFEWELSEASGKRRPRAYGNGSGRKEDGHKAVETVRRGASASTREKPGKNGGARNSSADPSSVIAQEML